ncbi:MAG: T9SS type B sorting domain-containing protein [Sphingobacteriales bacterium]|nr:MAG: T9SS type B sorting domain-containing protein [Sphingobacteriales bacterium]
MMLTSTRIKWSPTRTFYILIISLLTLNFSKSYAQRVYANIATVKSTVVDNASNAADATSSFATVKSYGGLALGIGKYSGELELRFPGNVPANKTTFVRIDFNADVLNSLLGGNLGSELANLVGTLVLGNHYFEVGARNSSGTTVLSGASSGPFSNTNLRIVKDAAGAFYVAITPDQVYDRIYIKDNTDAALLGANNETRVYHAFYTSGSGVCDPAFATDFDGTGLTASVLGIGKAGVTNMENAIDNNPNTASEISLGVIGVAGSISQNIYFNTPSNASDELNIRFQLNPNLVSLGLLNNISIETFLGNSLVSSAGANSLLSLDLLGLLNSGQPVCVGLTPGQPFDRVKVTLSALAGVGIAQTLNLFSVTRTAPRPTFVAPQSNALTSCYNATATLGATTAVGNQLVWYDVSDGGTTLATTASTGTYTTPVLTTNKTYYVAAKFPGCDESIRVPIVVTVNPAIVFGSTTLNNAAVGSTYSKQINAATGGTPGYTYALAVGSSLPAGLALSTGGLIAGTPTTAGNYTFNIAATDTRGCSTTTSFNLAVGNTLALGPATLPDGTVGSAYAQQILPAATSGNAPITYSATGLPPGLSFNPATRAITGTPTAAGSYTITLTATDNGGNFINRDYSLVVVGPLTLAAAPLPNGTINEAYPTQTLAQATGGTAPYTYSLSGLPAGLAFNNTTRQISGTPTVAGVFPLVLTATDAIANTATANYSITVNTVSGSPDCNAANSQTSGINGICVLCSVTGPNNSVDGDKNNFTRITLAVGVGASGFQRLNFAGAGLATDSIRLDLATPTGLLDLSVLSGITVNVLNGSAVVGTYALNSSLVNLQLLGGNRFTATVVAGAAFDRVEVSFSATVAALTSLDIYGASIIYPKPTLAAAGMSICAGNTTTLTATPNGGTSLAWYAAAAGGTALATGNTFTTPTLTTNTTYYIEVSRAGCANPTRVPVNVVVTPVVAVPTTAAAVTGCEGSSVTLSVTNPDPTVTYTWYTVATGGTPLFTGSTYTTPALANTTTFYVGASKNSCTSASRASVAVTVGARPVVPSLQASATTVSPGQSVVLTATSSDAAAIFKWYSSANSTSPVYTGATYVTPPLLATTSYYVETSFAGSTCVSTSRAMITITVDGSAPSPVPCEAATTQTNGVTGIALLAGVNNPELAIDNDSRTSSTLVMPVGALGASVYQRLGFGGTSTIGDTVRVVITSPGKLLSLSLLSSIELSTLNGGVANNDGLVANNPIISIELLTGGTDAVLTYVPTQVFDAVEIRLNSGALGALTSLGVNYAQRVLMAPEVNQTNVSACLNQPVTLSVKNPKANLTYKWYNAAGVYQSGMDGVTFTTPAITANTRYFVAASSASGCVSYKTGININLSPAPLTPELVSPNVTTCLGSSVLLEVKNPIAGTIYKWYDGAGVYQVGKDGVSFTIASVTGNLTYQVEAVNSCGTASARATATVKAGTLDLPILNPTRVTISSGSPAVLSATSSTPGAVINWYATATSTTILATGTTFVTPALTATTTYYVEAVVPGGCPASGRASITVTVVPNGPQIITPCGSATIAIADGVSGVAVLAGVNNPSLAVDDRIETGSTLVMPIGVLGAYVYQRIGFGTGLSNVGDTLRIRISSPGKLVSVGALTAINVITYNGTTSNNDLIAATNGLVNLEVLSDNSAAILTYVPTSRFNGVEVRLNSGLAGTLTSVNLNYAQRINASPKVSAANVNACQGTSAVLNVSNPIVGVVYKWYLNNVYQAGKDGASFSTDASLSAGTYSYKVTAFANGCESAPTTVTVIVLPAPAPPVATPGNPASTCLNTPVTLSVQQVVGLTYRWYDANGNLLPSSGNSYATAANLAAGSYTFFVEAVSGNSCSSSTRTSIPLTVGTSAIAADIQITGATSVCSSSSTTLTASSTSVTNPIFTWYSSADLTSVVFTGPVFTTPVLSSNTTYYVTVKGSNKCENALGAAAVVALTIGTPALASDIQINGSKSVCNSSPTTLTATSATVTNPIFTWYSNANLTTKVFTGAVFTTPVLTSNATYYVTVKGSNKCENVVGSAAVVSLTINNSAVAADINVTGTTTLCASASAVLTASSTTVTNPIFKWYSDQNLTNLVFTGPTFTSPTLTTNTSYYVTVSGDNKCENASANAKVVAIVINPTVVAPVVASAGTFLCGSGATTLTVQNAQAGATYEFYSAATGGAPLFTGTSFTTPVLSSTTDYYVQAVNAGGCVSAGGRVKVTVTLTSRPISPTVAATMINTCIGSTAIIAITNPQTGLIYSYYAAPTGGTAIASGTSFTTPALTANITYYVEANTSSCSSSTRTAVTVNVGGVLPAPVIKVQTKTANSILFSWNAVDNATGYEVSIDGGTTWQVPSSGTNGTTHLASGLSAGQTITITVRAKGAASCQTSANAAPLTEQVSTLTDDLFIPNTFTPNGDGRNDVFNAYGNAVSRFKMRIYNQWGEFLAETNSLSQGWDGTFRGGMQPNGVYAYYIDVTFASGKTKMIKGTVTLLR